MDRAFCRMGTICFLLAASGAANGFAQAVVEPKEAQAQAPTVTVTVTMARVEELRKRLSEAQDLPETVPATITQLLDEAATDLTAAAANAEAAAAWQAQTESGDSLVDAAISESEKAVAPPQEGLTLEFPGRDPAEAVAALEQQLVAKRSELDAADEVAGVAKSEASRRDLRVKGIPDETSTLDASVVETRKRIGATPTADELPLLTDSRAARLQAKLLADESKLDAIRKEEVAYTATKRLLPLQVKLAERVVTRLRKQIDLLQTRLAEMRREQIATLRYRVVTAAKRSSKAKKELADLAALNLRLLAHYEKIASRSQEVKESLRSTEDELGDVKDRERTTVDRVQAVGLTDALALLLTREKSEMSSLRSENKPDPTLRDEVNSLQVITYILDDEAQSTTVDESESEAQSTTDDESESQSTTVDESESDETEDPGEQPAVKSDQQVAAENDAISEKELAKLKTDILQKMVAVSGTLFHDLVALDTAQRQMREVIDRYLAFIEGNLLWTRNSPFILMSFHQDPSDLVASKLQESLGGNGDEPTDEASPTLRGIYWLFSPSNWLLLPHQLKLAFNRSPIVVVLLLLLLCGLILGRQRSRELLQSKGELARRKNCMSIEPTLRATAATLMIAAPVPAILACVGLLAWRSEGGNEFLFSLGQGLCYTAVFLIPFELTRHVCRGNGLGIDHFDWAEPVCKRLRKGCRDIATVGGPLVLISEMLHAQSDDEVSATLGRYVVIALAAVFLIELRNLLKPSRLWVGHFRSNSIFYRYRRSIYVIALQVPLGIIALISFGYEYMTVCVMDHLLLSLVAFLIIILLEAIAMRALLVRRRRITIEQFRQRRASASEETDVAAAAGIDLTEQESDVAAVSLQAQQLVRLLALSATIVSLAWIWSELLPALKMLDGVGLWSTGTTDVEQVTLRDLIFTLLIIGLTIYAVKSLPALFELFFLQQLEPGARYAVTTIFRYVIGVAGVVFGLSFLSIPWSQLSWILAAASVGLGFGLQEILANFVSGIILLLEQPIRVGDVVTVDNTTGVVTRMQIRATTVTNYDRQELLIPNKDLVTGKLLNWTLSNVVNRIVIHVGVAYGSDPHEVTETLLRVIGEHPEVLGEPGPMVTFEEFGDSSLNFVVRCYLPTLDKRLTVTHQLHTQIAEAFESAGIEIPFPQRDIRMTLEPGTPVIQGAVKPS